MAVIGRISTYAAFTRTVNDFSRTQSNLSDLQGQISSGVKATDFAGLSGNVERFTGLEAKLSKTKIYQDNISGAITRLNTMSKAFDNITQIADDMNNLLTLRNSGTFTDTASFEQQMNNKRISLAKELNVSIGGRFIFAGTKTNIPPVIDDPVIPDPVNSGVVDDNYYQGSKEDFVLRPQDNFELRYNIRADNIGFQKIFTSISLSIDANTSGDKKMLADSIDMIQAGMKDLLTMQAETNGNIVDLRQINERHQTFKLYLKGVTEEIANTDILGASTKVAMDKNILSATFQSFATLNNLRLINYLK